VNYAIVLAGGQGVRMGVDIDTPKQFILLAGKPLILYSLETAQNNPNIDRICVVCPLDWNKQVWEWVKAYKFDKVAAIAESGYDRQKSVHNGLNAITADRNDIVIIMTAVCPFVSQQTINLSFNKMEEYDSVISVVKATDAITFSNDGIHASRTMQKTKMFIQQGPQLFRYGLLKNAHEQYESEEYKKEVNEDSELIIETGGNVGMVMGDRFCVKVTFPEDIAIAEALKPLFDEKEHREGVGLL